MKFGGRIVVYVLLCGAWAAILYGIDQAIYPSEYRASYASELELNQHLLETAKERRHLKAVLKCMDKYSEAACEAIVMKRERTGAR